MNFKIYLKLYKLINLIKSDKKLSKNYFCDYIMSTFKENFERGGDKEELDYDDSAFYYFGLAMLFIVLVPASYYMIIKPVLFGEY